ncbi:MAG: CinA family protein [Gammaproteobacteria bacterium]|nr:CinA family protein [Gammaproteobacteria bacterium]MDP2140980.1 CinA family protein [Gammaproteobacteria bacterium]MDP2349276.1 CinA family protein [Gammaproteobacteria bacterium]
MNKVLYNLSEQCGALLLQHHWQLTTAESCTGGWIARSITAVAGSSEWFETGLVTYSDAAKQKLLNVPAEYFEPGACGAVSEETVIAMAFGALRVSGAQFAVATSGIAGPGGGNAHKPVGTVWIGWATQLPGTSVRSLARVQRFGGDRESVRRQTVQAALEGLLQQLREETK